MRAKLYFLVTVVLVLSGLFFGVANHLDRQVEASPLMMASLCDKGEKVVFSCAVKRSGKIVSLCSSPKLSKTEGYLQYRFGRTGQVELEFPKERSASRGAFKYSHYFRAQVDSTEISFTVNGYTYSVFDEYNGEEKPVISEKGLTVTSESTKKEVKYLCQGKPTANYADLPGTFENSSPQD
jgi:hypothetical protein